MSFSLEPMSSGLLFSPSYSYQPFERETVKLNPEARVVILSSASERMASSDIYNIEELKTTTSNRSTTAWYSLSKLADIHYTSEQAERDPDLKIPSVHPGMVATNVHHNSTGFFLKLLHNIAISAFGTPAKKGALSQTWAAVSPDAETRKFYGPVGVLEKGSQASRDHQLQEQIWN